jgi:hypothetical protein
MTILEAVEHNASEWTGTGTPDQIETDIIRIVSTVPVLARVEAWRPGETPWTVHISRALAQLGKARGFNVRGKHCEGIADQGEWLFDHVWIDGERVPLVLESEWGHQKKSMEILSTASACAMRGHRREYHRRRLIAHSSTRLLSISLRSPLSYRLRSAISWRSGTRPA